MKPKVLFVTNFITHYRRDLYVRMAENWEVRFLFYSDGAEWYWRWPVEPIGDLPGRYLPGRWFFGTRWSWTLLRELWTTDAEVIVKCLGGRFALPATVLIARIRRIPFVFWFSVFELPRHGLQRFSRPLVAAIARRAAAVVTNGPHQSALVRELGVPHDRISESPWATPREPFLPGVPEDAAARILDGPRPAFVVGYVGRLERWKGADLAVEAVAGLVASGLDARLLVAGDGSELPALQELVTLRGLGARVRFLGRVAYEALPATYRAMDVVVIPSRAGERGHTEDWSSVANEAMTSGVVVVASTAVGAVRGGLVEDGLTGRVFEEGDAGALTAALFDLAADPDERSLLRRTASERVARYTYEAAVRGFEIGVERALANRDREVPA